MSWLGSLFDFALHADVHLKAILQQYGAGTYAILFVIIFCETGLVVTPFLPGDSLLFAAGIFAGSGVLSPLWLFVLLSIAAVAGDTVNYWIGYFIGPRVFQESDARFFRREYLERTQRFYERHGGKTIVIARFVPIIRTFAPFVAGVARMEYRYFVTYNVLGGCLWIGIFVFGGYYFHGLPVVREHFSLVIAAIIVLSVLPVVVEFVRHHWR